MRVGFDLHGVLDAHPFIFRESTKEIMKGGDEIYIITGPPEVQAQAELEALGFVQGINYTKIVSVVDWLKSHLKEDEMWLDDKNTWWCDDANWWCSKARICTEYSIYGHIDDSEKYLLGWDVTDCKTEFHLIDKDGVIERKR